jgi:Xaa-Pro aminopeptidase
MPIIQISEFIRRRQQCIQAMEPNTAAIIMAAPECLRNGDAHYAYRQKSDFYYLTGFSEPEAILLLLPGRAEGETVLFNRERDPAKEVWTGRRVGQAGACENYGVDEAYPISEYQTKLPELLQGRYEISLDSSIHEMRLFKSPAEIMTMRKAAEISVQAHLRAMRICQPGMFEYELEAELLHEFYRQGSRAEAYTSIVGSGENSCILHYVDNNSVIKNGDLVLIDAGCEYECYASDITRTFPANGRFNTEQRAIYEIVLQAQLAAIAAVKPGVAWNTFQTTCVRVITSGLLELGLLKGNLEDLIAQKAYFPFYMHGAGHWLGLDVHDAGNYNIEGKPRNIEPNMVFTVEPGIYIAPHTPNVDPKWWNIGVRIEDDILVTANSCEVLSGALPKTVSDIEALMMPQKG